MAKNRTPHARNFRIYAEEADDRRVTIRSRKGAGFYTNPQGEGITTSQTATTGSDTTPIDISTEWKADTFTPVATAPLTRLGIKMKSNGASGAIVVEIREDNGGVPGNLLAKSGILGSEVDTALSYVNVRFVEAPYLTSGTPYWFVLHMQEDGVGQYLLATTTAATTALTSNTAGLSWSASTYGINFNAYISTDVRTKGITRYAPTNGENETVAYIGTNLYSVNDLTGNFTSIKSGLNAGGERGYFTYADDKVFFVNAYDDVQVYDGTSVTLLTHSQLPILRLATFHHNRLFGVSADDPNKLVFSEDPGNDDGAGNEWYEAWLSTSFIYIPTPKASEPITAIVPFQDNLVVFTKNSKYTLYGSDPGTFTVRQATGKKGAASQNGVFADENYIYFVSDDGFYRFNGSEDEIISDMTERGGGSIQPEFSNIADPGEVFVTKWKRTVRFYYPVRGSSFNSRCLLFHTVFQEWMLDTDAYVSHAVHWNDSQDDNQLVEASSTAPTLYYAEVDDNNLGKAIDFIYDCPYDSMGNPAVRKRIVKLFPLLEGEGTNYSVQVGVDRDRQNTPRLTDLPLTVGGALIGHFNIGDGTVIGGINQYKPTRVRVAGYAYYWQIRISHEGINNPIQFVGYVVSIRAKRL
jgi:hypothetical protein